VVVNTCAVTAEATRQARQAIRRARRENPEAPIFVTGCAAQVQPESFAAMPEVTRVIGNGDKLDPAAWADPFGVGAQERVRVNDVTELRETALHLVESFEGRTRAFVQVQNGCDHRCTFCIIPYGRGPSRSVPVGAVVDQVRRLVGNGFREVVLTGVDITSYGADLPGTPALGRLVQAILTHVPELDRLRLSSLDAVEIDGALREAIASEPRLMPHLHLSLQAGDDMILKRMKRRHSRSDAVRFCDEMRAHRSDIVLGADLIAGFPTETDAMFDNTLRAVEECGLTHLHVFPFSPRPGTPAARMPQLPRDVVKERARRLRERGAERLARHLAAQIGRERMVLVETGERGRTEDFTLAALEVPAEPGSLLRARITGHDGRQLIAQAA